MKQASSRPKVENTAPEFAAVGMMFLAYATDARLSRHRELLYQNKYPKPEVHKPQKGAFWYH